MLVWNRPALLFISLRLAAGAMGHGPEMFQTFNQQHNPLQKFGKIAKTYGALRQGLRWAPMGPDGPDGPAAYKDYYLRYVVHNVCQSKQLTQKFTPEIYKFDHKQKRPYTLSVNYQTRRVTKCYRPRELNLRCVTGAQTNRQRACLIRLAGQSNTCNSEQQPVW